MVSGGGLYLVGEVVATQSAEIKIQKSRLGTLPVGGLRQASSGIVLPNRVETGLSQAHSTPTLANHVPLPVINFHVVWRKGRQQRGIGNRDK